MLSEPFIGAPWADVTVAVSFGTHVCADVADDVSVTVKHSPGDATAEPVSELPLAPPGVYTPRKHHVPSWFAVTAAESAVDEGGFEPAVGFRFTGLPTCEPPVAQVPPET